MTRLAETFGPYQRRIFFHTLLCLLSSILLLLIFPKFDLRFLAPFALAPLLFVMAKTPNGWQRFAYGWAAGIFYWFFLCTWIQFVLEVHGGMGRWGGWGAFFLFSVLKALHLAVFSCLAGPLMRTVYAVPAVAALWTGIERTHGTFGFAWLDLGNAGIQMSIPLRVAPFVGVYGLSFIFAMFAAAVACVLLRYPRRWLACVPVVLLIFLLPANSAADACDGPRADRSAEHRSRNSVEQFAPVQDGRRLNPAFDGAAGSTRDLARTTRAALLLQRSRFARHGGDDC